MAQILKTTETTKMATVVTATSHINVYKQIYPDAQRIDIFVDRNGVTLHKTQFAQANEKKADELFGKLCSAYDGAPKVTVNLDDYTQYRDPPEPIGVEPTQEDTPEPIPPEETPDGDEGSEE